MTRKHYVQFASLVADLAASGLPIDGLIDLLCSLFVRDNPRFNKARFRAACHVSDPLAHLRD